MKETVQALQAEKDAAAVEGTAKVEAAEAGLRDSLRNVFTSRVAIIESVRAIRDEHLWMFAKTAEGKPHMGWKPFVRSVFRDETAEWPKDLRDGFIVLLVGEGFTNAEAADALNVSTATADRAVRDANVQSAGETDAETATRAAQQSTAASDKLIDQLRKFMATVPDRGKVTTAQLVDVRAVLSDLDAAVGTELTRREHKPPVAQQGTNPRTGSVAPTPKPGKPSQQRQSA